MTIEAVFHCDRCSVAATTKMSNNFPEAPDSWSMIWINSGKWQLCPLCAQDYQVKFKGFLGEVRKQ